MMCAPLFGLCLWESGAGSEPAEGSVRPRTPGSFPGGPRQEMREAWPTLVPVGG